MAVLDVETLLAHEAFVRRVTCALVRDEHEADDVVQATFLAAMERPPREGTNLRGWLAAVSRNLARRAYRSREREARRRERLRPRPAPGPDEAAQRREIEHTVMAAVLALEEPYRRTVLHRYHDGLSVGECAERLGVPLATVKTRLRRALARLRARLDERHGGRALWPAVLVAGWPSPSRAAVGVLVMGQFAKLAVVLGILATGLLLWWSATPQQQTTRTEAARASVAAGKEAPARRVRIVQSAGEAPEAEARPKDPVSIPQPAPRRIVGRFVLGDGRGAIGLQVMAYCDGKRERLTHTDQDGWFSLAGLDGSYDLFVLRGVRTWKGSRHHVAKLPGTFRTGTDAGPFAFEGIHGRVRDADGELVESGIVVARRVGEHEPRVAADVRPTGHFSFFDIEEGTYRLTYKTRMFGSEVMTVSGGEAVSAWQTDVALQLQPGDTIEGIVVDEKRQPRAGVWVRTTTGTTLTGATTDEEGRFLIKGLAAGKTCTLTTWISGYIPEVRAGIRAGTRGLFFQLDPGQVSTGRLLDADDRPVAKTKLTVRAGGRSLPLSPETDDEGRFTLPGLPDEVIRISLRKESWEIRAGERDIVLRTLR